MVKSARAVIPRAQVDPDRIVDWVELDFDMRHRRRVLLTTRADREVLLDLAQPAALADGDALALEGGELVGVRAAPEALLEVRCADPGALVRVAWHLGNRHLPTEITAGALYIRYDHVIEDMLAKLGAQTQRLERGFQPEGGAYGHGRTHGHHHGHAHDHHHDHAHDHSHG